MTDCNPPYARGTGCCKCCPPPSCNIKILFNLYRNICSSSSSVSSSSSSSNGRVLIYSQNEQACQPYSDMKSYYNSISEGCDWWGCGTGGEGKPPGFNINNYNLIFVIMETSIDSSLSSANVASWLATGQKRFVITGEFGPSFDTSSAFANSYCSALGVSLQCTLGTQIAHGDCSTGFSCTLNSGYYLTSGLSSWLNADSSVVTGGTSLADSGGDGATLAVQKIGDSEVILSGDSNCFGGVCPLFSQNEPLLYRLIHYPVL